MDGEKIDKGCLVKVWIQSCLSRKRFSLVLLLLFRRRKYFLHFLKRVLCTVKYSIYPSMLFHESSWLFKNDSDLFPCVVPGSTRGSSGLFQCEKFVRLAFIKAKDLKNCCGAPWVWIWLLWCCVVLNLGQVDSGWLLVSGSWLLSVQTLSGIS